MKRIALRLPASERISEIWVGTRVLPKLVKYLHRQKPTQIVVIADQKLKVAIQALNQSLEQSSLTHSVIKVHAGESLKSFESVSLIYSELIKRKVDRKAVILALGGGSVGDAAGFVSSTYLRGIDWVSLPTTLLAQVDSAVGGKTGINHPDGKNLIGSFHQPALVLCELNFLSTLGQREIVSGLGEMIKYGISQDPGFYRQILKRIPKLLAGDAPVLEKCIVKSLGLKSKAVMQDERDLLGIREVLNFGHTFGHALETLTAYQKFQHGEAVIWGMRFAVSLSQVRGHLEDRESKEILNGLRALPVPALPKNVRPEQYFQSMSKDKKSEAGRVRFVLLKGLGRTVSDSNSSLMDLQEAFDRMISNAGARP